MPPDPTPAALTRLPKWAQTYIDRLQRQLHNAQEGEKAARLATNPDETDTVIDAWDKTPIGLPKGETVRFRVPWHYDGTELPGYVDVRVKDEEVQVMGSQALRIILHSANLFTVRVER